MLSVDFLDEVLVADFLDLKVAFFFVQVEQFLAHQLFRHPFDFFLVAHYAGGDGLQFFFFWVKMAVLRHLRLDKPFGELLQLVELDLQVIFFDQLAFDQLVAQSLFRFFEFLNGLLFGQWVLSADLDPFLQKGRR